MPFFGDKCFCFTKTTPAFLFMKITEAQIWQLLEQVSDPEIPVLSVVDLGIVREVLFLPPNNPSVDANAVEIVITPTYSGCPAMNAIEIDIKSALQDAGIVAKVRTVLSPAWTTDWLSENGRQKLKKYGIAPPEKESNDKNALFLNPQKPACPQCDSHNTQQISAFGSTACKALYRCLDCLEPFDYFKCH